MTLRSSFRWLVAALLLAPLCSVLGAASEWELIDAAGPPARAGHAMVATDGRLFVFGGDDAPPGKIARVQLNDLWAYNEENNEWAEEFTDPPAEKPSPRSGHGMVVQAEQRAD